MKYRLISKPVEAHQYTGHNAEEFVDRFGARRYSSTILVVVRSCETSLDEGDWLLVDHNGKRNIVSDANFKSRYEPAE